MSTRANVIIKDEYSQVIFYRHSDGYPDGVKATLNEFLNLVKEGKIRNNVSQSSGWLVLLGYEEYSEGKYGNTLEKMRKGGEEKWGNGWKVGAYEPTSCIHGDIEYLYEIDLEKETLRGWEHDGKEKGKEVTADLTNS